MSPIAVHMAFDLPYFLFWPTIVHNPNSMKAPVNGKDDGCEGFHKLASFIADRFEWRCGVGIRSGQMT